MRLSVFTALIAASLLGPNLAGVPATAQPTSGAVQPVVTFHVAKVRGLDIFYREAGPANAPTVLLLHGFPSSSHMFRDLIPRLAARYHVIAPDYPGFGNSSAPAPEAFAYNFANLATLMDEFVTTIGVDRYALYMQDYGGPIGIRLAIRHPERVRALVVQNAVANVEGWNPAIVKGFAPGWANRTTETEKAFRGAFTAEATKLQYIEGVSRTDRIDPDAWIVDQALLDRPGNDRIQVELLYQYQHNIALYPQWQAFLKSAKFPTLVVWGEKDPIFTTKGRDLYKTLVPDTEVRTYAAGHFALETHAPEIAGAILDFLDRLPPERK
ncbi:alpha/beta fold hydrolase [Sphingomonas sp.]|uniref:alpha/beta fold hydrolase n=1 Tax=Sphingomonas sp. TaxID=28214 RepID=UPI0025DCFBA5|nr:alpha/beta hydrolase [Sphingomonas sp.]